MKYQTTNEFDNFDFTEAYVQGFVQRTGSFYAVLDQVKIKPENSKNRDIRMMRTNGLKLSIIDAEVLSVVEEGIKVYNADYVLQQEIADRTLQADEYTGCYEMLEGCEVIGIEKEDTTYLFLVAGEERNYQIRVKGSGDAEEWDRFMNLAE